MLHVLTAQSMQFALIQQYHEATANQHQLTMLDNNGTPQFDR